MRTMAISALLARLGLLFRGNQWKGSWSAMVRHHWCWYVTFVLLFYSCFSPFLPSSIILSIISQFCMVHTYLILTDFKHIENILSLCLLINLSVEFFHGANVLCCIYVCLLKLVSFLTEADSGVFLREHKCSESKTKAIRKISGESEIRSHFHSCFVSSIKFDSL